MKKCVWTLNVDGYAPEITKITYPLLQAWAHKIGADFRVISERKFPDWPPVYEKLQLHELGREYEWNIYIDSDALVHPDMLDPSEFIKKDTVMHNGADMANNRWRYDHYFRRDGRHIGSCNWFTVASEWCLDLWTPLQDLTFKQAVQNIFPIQAEVASGVITPDHLIDDYALSRNIARFGLKFTTLIRVLKDIGDDGSYLWHQYTLPMEQKIYAMNRTLLQWKVKRMDITNALGIEGMMRPSELEWLAAEASVRRTIAEIGPYYGRSTRALADATQGTIDVFDDFWGPRDLQLPDDIRAGIYERFRKNLGDCISTGKVRIHKGKYEHLKVQGEWDMIFLDGSHDYASFNADLDRWVPHLAENGLLCGHDYGDGFHGIDRALKERGWPITVIPDTRIWCVDAKRIAEAKDPEVSGLILSGK